jgi:hypothetical protein
VAANVLANPKQVSPTTETKKKEDEEIQQLRKQKKEDAEKIQQLQTQQREDGERIHQFAEAVQELRTVQKNITERHERHEDMQTKQKSQSAKTDKPKQVSTTTDDAEPVVQISLIDRIIQTSSEFDKAFQSKSGDKTWVIVMETGEVKSGNLKKMKTALNKVGVTDEITLGLKDVTKFEKHKLGQAYHISKSMLTKALGITDAKLNGMANTDKWDDDMAVKLMMLDVPTKTYK